MKRMALPIGNLHKRSNGGKEKLIGPDDAPAGGLRNWRRR
jgi:hypothetical protein